jgi:deazaflavin-dependent oxidoreductase (nitroreductase family)
MADFNQQVIEEFRANDGKVGGMFENMPMVLVTVTGRKTGNRLITPLAYSTDGDNIVIAASKGGADTDPAWFRNIQAEPHVLVEVGEDSFNTVAEIPEGAERDRLYAQHAEAMPQFKEYEQKTDRKIPVVLLPRA